MRYILLALLTMCLACGKLPHEVGGTAPDFALKDTAGKVVKLSDYKGKAVLLHFWTDFCKSCKVEFPKIQEMHEDIKSNDFALVAVNLGQSKEISQKFQQEFGATFPMLIDSQNLIQTLYQVKVYPTNVFINPEGKIVRIIRGWTNKQTVEVFIAQHTKS